MQTQLLNCLSGRKVFYEHFNLHELVLLPLFTLLLQTTLQTKLPSVKYHACKELFTFDNTIHKMASEAKLRTAYICYQLLVILKIN